VCRYNTHVSFPRVFWSVGDPVGGVAAVTGDEAHHLRQVLRVQPGTRVGLFDGRGHEWIGTVDDVTKQVVQVIGLTPAVPVAESRVSVTLAVGVLKGDQMDTVVRDATMLGVTSIVPVRTAHVSVPARAWQSGAAQQRWQRVAVASAGQCRRAVVPTVRPVADFDACLSEAVALRLICLEPTVHSAVGNVLPEDWRTGEPPASVQVLVGPEGGWSMAEVEQALAAGAKAVSLGPRTLRAETAPLVALTLVSATWGW